MMIMNLDYVFAPLPFFIGLTTLHLNKKYRNWADLNDNLKTEATI